MPGENPMEQAMSQSCRETDQMAKELGCNGNRVTPDSIDSRIAEIDYQTITVCGQMFMYCGIKMDNGFVVIGKPATCIDPANWREEIGKKVAYENAYSEIPRLEAYRKMSGA